MKQLRVMSFNIKNSRSGEETIFSWRHRRDKVIENIHHYKPDIVGFQEVFIEQLEFLSDQLSPEYSYQGVGRDDGEKEGEFCPIFYKRFSRDQSGTFWYSDSPEICSNSWNMYLPRICTWINFSNSVAFYNTHLDDRDPVSRKRSIELLLKQMTVLSSNKAIILVGDLNCDRTSSEFSLLREKFVNSYWEKNKSFLNRSASFHGFTGKKTSLFAFNGKRIIDHILVSKEMEVVDSNLCYYNVGGHQDSYPSDHWPLLANLEFKTK